MLALAAMAIYILLLYAIESILAVMNYNVVSSNLIEFLNMTSNYLETSGTITEAFGKVAKYMPEPLKTALMDCNHEARTSGDSRQALLSLADRIEHPIFKDVILNIEMSMQYSANFRNILASCRRHVIDEREEKKLREDLIYDAVTSMGIIGIIIVLFFNLAGEILKIPVMSMLTTTYGKIGLAVIGCSYIAIFWKLFTDRQVR